MLPESLLKHKTIHSVYFIFFYPLGCLITVWYAVRTTAWSLHTGDGLPAGQLEGQSVHVYNSCMDSALEITELSMIYIHLTDLGKSISGIMSYIQAKNI